MAVLTLHRQGHSSRKIAKDLEIGRTAAIEIIRSGAVASVRRAKAHRLDAVREALRELHLEC